MKNKLKIENLKLTSFITTLAEEQKNKIKAGANKGTTSHRNTNCNTCTTACS
ncbi:MAG: pinensin family lanthipeptide [Acidobacteriota bacterium]|nr:pinensin family lanthipeptide [Acidobacteriota bacterium]